MQQPMTWDIWKNLPESSRAALRDLSGLTPQLKGLEGCRVASEVTPLHCLTYPSGCSIASATHTDVVWRISGRNPRGLA